MIEIVALLVALFAVVYAADSNRRARAVLRHVQAAADRSLARLAEIDELEAAEEDT